MRRTSCLLAAIVLGACEGSQSALDPRGVQAERIYTLGNVMLVGATIVFVVVVALVLAAALLPRRAADEQRRLRWVLGGVIGTVAILVAMLVYNAVTASAIAADPRDPLEIRVVARQWWWDVTYVGDPPSESVRTANEIAIPVGRPVRITLESHDVIHSFWVPNLHGKRDAIPGRTTAIWLQADEAGTYRGQCAEFCGLQHAHMALLVLALPPYEFETWLAEQRRPARPPAGELAQRGQEVFVQTCGKCHAVRGTTALASAGPDLTHLASRRTLAAATIPNRRGHLGGWILDPHHVKPGVYMPPVDLDSASVHAVLAYLETLR